MTYLLCHVTMTCNNVATVVPPVLSRDSRSLLFYAFKQRCKMHFETYARKSIISEGENIEVENTDQRS